MVSGEEQDASSGPDHCRTAAERGKGERTGARPSGLLFYHTFAILSTVNDSCFNEVVLFY